MVVTTDTKDYCRTLCLLLDQHRALPREVRELRAEGGDMCVEGQIRGGISRLRRALVALHEDDSTRP